MHPHLGIDTITREKKGNQRAISPCDVQMEEKGREKRRFPSGPHTQPKKEEGCGKVVANLPASQNITKEEDSPEVTDYDGTSVALVSGRGKGGGGIPLILYISVCTGGGG